jgi:hypothetical protein
MRYYVVSLRFERSTASSVFGFAPRGVCSSHVQDARSTHDADVSEMKRRMQTVADARAAAKRCGMYLVACCVLWHRNCLEQLWKSSYGKPFHDPSFVHSLLSARRGSGSPFHRNKASSGGLLGKLLWNLNLGETCESVRFRVSSNVPRIPSG